MARERIVPHSEVIRAILSEDSPSTGRAHMVRSQRCPPTVHAASIDSPLIFDPNHLGLCKVAHMVRSQRSTTSSSVVSAGELRAAKRRHESEGGEETA